MFESKVAASTHKKVLVVRFDRESLQGFVAPQAGFQPDGVELLTLAGGVLRVPYGEVKAVCFVRDFESGETWQLNRIFTARPKLAGLWVRVRFRDGDALEGLLSNNLMVLEPYGFTVVPPDPSFQNQKIFVPKAALQDVQVLGVIGSPLRRRRAKPAAQEPGQIRLFE